MRLRSLLLTFMMAFGLPALVFAQDGMLEGTITGADTGEPLPGATVFVSALQSGTSTNIDGEYSLELAAGEYDVRFTYVGFQTRIERVTISAGETTTLDVAMQLDLVGLDDVVVTGYGEVPKRNITGSIASIRGRDVNRLDVQSVDQAMQGRLPGVRVTNTSGQPGGGVHVRIRGLGSIDGGNAPLYVVDGVPISFTDQSSQASSNPLAGINPRDIESIEVLKDAAAASIYGAQASNGVVLVTTKRGVEGPTRFTVSSSVGRVGEIDRHDIIEGPEWLDLQMEAYAWWYEFNGLTREAGEARAMSDLGLTPETVEHHDWQDALMRTGVNRRVDLSARGGTSSTRFFVSGGYNFEEGTGINTDFERLNLRSNIEHDASDFLTLETNINLSTSRATGALSNGFFLGSPFYAGQRNRPTDPIFNEDGSFNQRTFNNYNAVEVNVLDDRENRINQMLLNAGVRLNLIDGLTFRSFYGLDYRNTRDLNYSSPESTAGPPGGSLFQADRQVTNFTTNQVFNYNADVAGNAFRGIAGFEYRHEDRWTTSMSGEGFPSGLFRTMQNAAEPTGVTGFGSEYKTAGFFGQAQYDFLDRYLFSATARYDGSSRFGADRRWGLFGSGAIAWVMSDESFMDFSNNWLDDLKLRASFGTTGNQSGISNFAPRTLFVSGGTYDGQPALRPGGLGNNVLTWESAQTLNLGIDWSILRGRVYGVAEVYRRDTDRLLLGRDLPSDSGFGSLTENVGGVRNEGIELELGAVLVNTNTVRWTSDFNITWLRNEVLALADGEDRLGTSIVVGRSLSSYYLRRYAGANPATGMPMFYDRNGNITYTPSLTGDLETDDREFVGTALPSSLGGWNNRVTVGNFTLDALVQFNFGQLTYDSFQGSFTDGAFFRQGGLIADTRNRWTEPGQITRVERAYRNSSYPGRTSGFTGSTRFLQDASYVRLKNVQLTYALPVNLTQRIGFQGAAVYVQGTNLLTLTNYPGIDPEVLGSNNAIYPQSRIFTTGIELNF